MIKTIFAVCLGALSSIGISGILSSANAQVVYTSPPPNPPELGESDRSPESLAEDSESLVMGSWDFSYNITPDDNLFVTRIFIVFLSQDSIGMTSQVDCGRAMYRLVAAPHLFRDHETPGVPMTDVSINTWEYFNRNVALGQAMMRTCESAAREHGVDWIWE
jgi:hypothetical protein